MTRISGADTRNRGPLRRYYRFYELDNSWLSWPSLSEATIFGAAVKLGVTNRQYMVPGTSLTSVFTVISRLCIEVSATCDLRTEGVLSIVAIPVVGRRNTGGHSERTQSSLGSQASLAKVDWNGSRSRRK